MKAYAWSLARRSGNDHRFHPDLGPGDHWWSLFKKRNPDWFCIKQTVMS